MDIGIREVRQLTDYVNTTHGVDYSEFALTSFKRRVELAQRTYNCNVDGLIKKLESKVFLDEFMGLVAVPCTELFRDPTFWVLLKNVYIPNQFKDLEKIRIWLPLCASGEEFYSLAILLKECGWTHRTQIYLTGVSETNLNQIKKGAFDNEKLEVSTKNYSRFQGTRQFTDYYKTTPDGNILFNQDLLSNVEFAKQSFRFDIELPPIHLILFRNQMIYFNTSLQNKVFDLLHSKLAVRSLLALGILEEIGTGMSHKYTAINKEEGIYQKR